MTTAPDQTAVELERLRDDLDDARREARSNYESTAQVASGPLRKRIARISETWLADISQRPVVLARVDASLRANLTVHFQRLLTLSEHSVVRAKYDKEFKAILADFTIQVIIPVKTRPQAGAVATIPTAGPHPVTAFVGHSFDPRDREIVDAVLGTLHALAVNCETGEKPAADRISEKVKAAIERNVLFVGLFTRREKLAGKAGWAASPWIIDEKAFAFAKGKKLILLKEDGVTSIGGIQGDYEYLDFRRAAIHELLLKILRMFRLNNEGLR